MKLKMWSLVLPLAIVGFIAPVLSSRSVAQQAPPPAAQPKQEELPPGPGREPFQRICTGCHSTTVVTSERHTSDEWGNILDTMRSRGANASDEELDKIQEWLTTNYPKKDDK